MLEALLPGNKNYLAKIAFFSMLSERGREGLAEKYFFDFINCLENYFLPVLGKTSEESTTTRIWPLEDGRRFTKKEGK